MRVIVTQEDIQHGERESCRKCPVALAIGRKLGIPVSVDSNSWMKIDGSMALHRLPSEAVDFISDFDRGREVRPLEFET